MKLKVKNLDVHAGGFVIAALHITDAIALDVYAGDRITLSRGNKKVTAIVDTTHRKSFIPPGTVGLFYELSSRLGFPKGVVTVLPAPKPVSVEYIRKKLSGKALSTTEMYQIVDDIAKNNLSDIELTYFVAAGYLHNFSLRETYDLTQAMIKTGQILKPKAKIVVDKHCIGGIPGNRTTPIVVAIVAAAGLTIPKTSSRSITSPAGTADTMEVMTNVTLPLAKVKHVVDTVGACLIWGGSLNLAPADDDIIQAEHPLSIDAEGQLIASIMAKKLSVSSNRILLDIPAAPDAKVTEKVAQRLKQKFIQIAHKFKVTVEVVITDGSQPIGRGIGPNLEARDVLYVLRNDPRAPLDLQRKCIFLSGKLLELGGKAEKGKGAVLAEQLLNSGVAFKKFTEIVRAQGMKVLDPNKILLARYRHVVRSPRDGLVEAINNTSIARLAKAAGAPIDKDAGIFLEVHKGDYVMKGQTLFTVFAAQKAKLEYAIARARNEMIVVVK